MKKMRVLGVGLLLSMVLAAPCQVLAESVGTENSGGAEVVSSEGTMESEIPESSEAPEEASQNKEAPVQESSTGEILTVDSVEKKETKVDNELKIWDVAYDKENDRITGKTEPGADVLIIHVDTGNSKGGVVIADAEGTFTYPNPIAGTIRFEAYLDGRKSAPYDIEVMKENVETTLAITNVKYTIKTQTIYGATAPNATVYIYLPSTGGQGMTVANDLGNFSVTDQFKAGTEVILTAADEAGNMGKPFSYTIPSAETMSAFEIRDIFYDHETQTFTGKTAPNAFVYFSVQGINQRVVVQADQNGHFVVTDQGEMQPGWVVTFSAFLDELISGTYEYTIPEVPTGELTVEPVKDTATKPNGKKEFPNTGATANIALSIVGGLAVLVAAVLIITRKLSGKKR